MKSKKILGIGNALVDILVQLEDDTILEKLNLPKGSMQLVDAEFAARAEKYLEGLPVSKVAGGSAANTIHGLAKLGIDNSFIGKIGEDAHGELFSKDLKSSGVVPLLMKGENETGRALALISPDSERTFGTFLGAAVELGENDLNESLFNNHGIMHMEGYLVQNHSLVLNAMLMAKTAGLLVSLDMASYNVVEDNLEFLKFILKDFVDIVFANEEEAKAFTGKEPEEALNILSELCSIAIVKIGPHGSMVKTKGVTTIVEARKTKSIDTTGAGDLYAAGFLYGLINDHPMQACGNIGSLLASKVIQAIGPRINPGDWDDILKEIRGLEY